MVGPGCCTTTGESTNLSMYRKCAESTLSTGSLNSSSNCCGSQQGTSTTSPRKCAAGVKRLQDLLRGRDQRPFRCTSGVESGNLQQECWNVGLLLRSSAWRGTVISHCLRHTACLTARVDDFCDHGHTMNHMFVGCLRRDCRHTETQKDVKEDTSTSGVAETSAMRYSAGLCRDTKPKSPQRQGRKIPLPQQHARSDVATSLVDEPKTQNCKRTITMFGTSLPARNKIERYFFVPQIAA